MRLMRPAVLGFAFFSLAAAPVGRTYHRVELRDLAAGKVVRTHVLLEGFVTYLKREEDGDLHIRICDSAGLDIMDRKRCAVGECISELPCEAPKIGQHVRVEGISRYDAENGHRWWECHPIEHLAVIP